MTESLPSPWLKRIAADSADSEVLKVGLFLRALELMKGPLNAASWELRTGIGKLSVGGHAP